MSNTRLRIMCQHFTGHKVRQVLDAFHSLPVTNNHWQNEVVYDCKIPRYIQILGVEPPLLF